MTFLDRAYEMKHCQPRTALEEVLRSYSWASTDEVLDIVLDNWRVLKKAGLLEEAFIEAWSTQKWGTMNWTRPFTRAVFAHLDRAALLKAGDPLPPGDSFTVYRGVAGTGARRCVRGYSWTGDESIAKDFAAVRAQRFGLPNPAVYRAIIARKDVLAYIDASGRNEKEFLATPRELSKLLRV